MCAIMHAVSAHVVRLAASVGYRSGEAMTG